jgi:hypothetical protein
MSWDERDLTTRETCTRRPGQCPQGPHSLSGQSRRTHDQDARAPECSLCGKRMECVSRESRPSWRDIMSSSFRPHWYDDG